MHSIPWGLPPRLRPNNPNTTRWCSSGAKKDVRRRATVSGEGRRYEYIGNQSYGRPGSSQGSKIYFPLSLSLLNRFQWIHFPFSKSNGNRSLSGKTSTVLEFGMYIGRYTRKPGRVKTSNPSSKFIQSIPGGSTRPHLVSTNGIKAWFMYKNIHPENCIASQHHHFRHVK